MERKLNHIAIPSSEITPERLYLTRRDFMKAAGIASATAFLAACGVAVNGQNLPSGAPLIPGWSALTPTPSTPVPDDARGQTTDELGNKLNTLDDITNYNNYYEFSEDKQAPSVLSRNYKPLPWSLQVGGLVHNPKTYAIEDLLKFQHKDRVYRLRCVEAWSMVIPWSGFELNDLLKEVQPMTSAKYVTFTTLMDTKQFPNEATSLYPWPYTEGLRLDEAMHRLTILATGMYGHSLPNVDGAPLRLVVPWKYGFKNIKAIVKIDLADTQPATFWNTISSNEYGFYSNVNPNVDHPRWTQATERRIGELGRRPTLMFNGYYDEVASLYSGMNLKLIIHVKKTFPWLRILVHLLGWLPLVYLIYAFHADQLTINPIQDLEQILGRISIYWMVATLAVTPLYTLTGMHNLQKRRRAVGLYAFLYTCLHVLVFFGLDYAFNLAQVWILITGKVYLLVGVLALLLLIPLAVTSFDYFIRKMGRNWKRLHWLVYPAVVVSVLHYGLAQKGDLFTLRGNILRPFLWLLLTILLLVLRLPPVRKWLIGTRRRVFVRDRRLPQASKIDAG